MSLQHQSGILIRQYKKKVGALSSDKGQLRFIGRLFEFTCKKLTLFCVVKCRRSDAMHDSFVIYIYKEHTVRNKSTSLLTRFFIVPDIK